MANNINLLIKKFEETCDNTTELNLAVTNMSDVMDEYKNTLKLLKDTGKIENLRQLGQDIENKIENIEAYNSKVVLDSVTKNIRKSEEKIKFYIKEQLANISISSNVPDEVSTALNQIMLQQSDLLDKVTSVQNDKIIRMLELELKNANKKIEQLRQDNNIKERYYESKFNELEKKIFEISDQNRDNFILEDTVLE